MAYTAPVEEMAFLLRQVAGLDALLATGKFGDMDADLVLPILEEAGKLAGEVLAPLNAPGDKAGAQLTAAFKSIAKSISLLRLAK